MEHLKMKAAMLRLIEHEQIRDRLSKGLLDSIAQLKGKAKPEEAETAEVFAQFAIEMSDRVLPVLKDEQDVLLTTIKREVQELTQKSKEHLSHVKAFRDSERVIERDLDNLERGLDKAEKKSST